MLSPYNLSLIKKQLTFATFLLCSGISHTVWRKTLLYFTCELESNQLKHFKTLFAFIFTIKWVFHNWNGQLFWKYLSVYYIISTLPLHTIEVMKHCHIKLKNSMYWNSIHFQNMWAFSRYSISLWHRDIEYRENAHILSKWIEM